MSRTTIPSRVTTQLLVRAGGRCEMPGCNKVLWEDGLTHARVNQAFVAHIVADSPGGPRGDPARSAALSSDFGNLMLLCPEHHKLIDERFEEYPEDLLRRYKRAHERRIQYLTGLDERLKTHLLFFRAPIAGAVPTIDFETARLTVVPRYPADDVPTEIDLVANSSRESDDQYFAWMAEETSRRIARFAERALFEKIAHVSVFALASIPLLAYLGREIGELLPADIYQYQRTTGSWSWQNLMTQDLNFATPRVEGDPSRIALAVSLSGTVRQDEIEEVLGRAHTLYSISASQPSPDLFTCKEQLEAFGAKYRSVLSQIRADHGSSAEVHLFPAVPASAAFLLGRRVLPKVDPVLHIYERDRTSRGFYKALSIPR